MGIGSLILGILSFLISFSWFADLSLILGVLAAVLGIISIVKKKNKGFGIAGTVLSVLAIIILFSTGDTDTTGTGITISTDNTGSEVTTISDLTKNIQIEKVGITKARDMVLRVTNNNDKAVCLDTITTIFKDNDGTFLEKVEAENSFVCIPAKSSTLVYNWYYDTNYSKYSNYEFSCELSNISEWFVCSGIDITSKNTGKQIAVTATNNSGNTITEFEILVAYYKNDAIIGVESEYSSDRTENGSNIYLNVSYPEDYNYNELSFDKYEVYFIKAGIE